MVIHGSKRFSVELKISAILLLLTTLSFTILTLPSASADVVDEIEITVPVSCSMSSTVSSEHASEVNNGQTVNDIGTTNLKVICNDNSGYAIYAIGYTDDTYGKTVLTSSTLGSTHDITTATTVTTGTSSWAMKLASVSGTYAPIIAGSTGDSLKVTGDPDFSDYTAVPQEYTKVAYYISSTDTGNNATGSNLTTSYRAYISPSQPAGTYIGQVKYTLVHPYTTSAPVPPLASTDCPAGYVCYAPNASDIDGSMATISNETIASSDKAGKISVGQSASATPTLIAPNYKRSGYGFAGWSTDFEATNSSIIYGPNETITVDLSNSGLILYPVWVESAGNLQGWTGCSSLTTALTNTRATRSSVTALTDTRDGNVYAVARLADGKCWMTENLRLDDSAVVTISNTHNPIHDANNDVVFNSGGVTTNHIAVSSNSWCTQDNSVCDNQTKFNSNNINRSLISSYNSNGKTTYYQWYGYGNYYNWYSATAGNGTKSTFGGNVDGDLCPIGWRLPKGDNYITNINDMYILAKALMGGIEPNAGDGANGHGYYSGTTNGVDLGVVASKKLRYYPNNFVYSGSWNGSEVSGRGSYGSYWSSSSSSYDGDPFYIGFSYYYVYDGVYTGYKYGGDTIRCIADS